MGRQRQGDEVADWRLTVRLEPGIRNAMVARAAARGDESLGSYVKGLVHADLGMAGPSEVKPLAVVTPTATPQRKALAPPKVTDHAFKSRGGTRPWVCFTCGNSDSLHVR
jgi:hypothetical protein